MSASVRCRVLIPACLTLALITGHRLPAAMVFSFNGTPVVWPGAQSVRSLSPTTFPTGSNAETIILEAMALWNIVPGSAFEFFFSPLTQDFPIDPFDGFNDTVAVPAAQLDPGVLALTVTVNQGAEWFDTDILFSDNPDNAGYTLDPNPPCDVVMAPVPTNGYAFLIVATHELGHALGLGHDPVGDEPPDTPWFVATMNPLYPSGGTIGQLNIVEAHADDRNGLRFLYPDAAPGAAPVADLASSQYVRSTTMGASVPLAFTPAELFPGDTILAASLIENFGTVDVTGVRQGYYLSTDATIDTADLLLGSLTWDLLAQDALEFGVSIVVPDDLPAGFYFLGAILDDLDQVTEQFEDNNAAFYCDPVTIAQFAPAIDTLGTQTGPCGRTYTGPAPTLARPLNMNPAVWTLDAAPAGMTIDPATGVVTWLDPQPSPEPYSITIRATNAAGDGTLTWTLSIPGGDLTGDGLLNSSDVTALPPCLTGPGTMSPAGCRCADFDLDGDIDLADLQDFLSAIATP